MGLGLFARTRILSGDFILEYTGVRVPTPVADSLPSRYLFEIDEHWTVDGSPLTNAARYINHSCDPNCEARLRGGRILIYCVRAIDRDEELTIDYGDEYFDEFIKPAGCKCDRCEKSTAPVSVGSGASLR